jgi:FixJ family two-component response regulator
VRRVVFVDDDEDLLEAMREILHCSALAECVAVRSLAELERKREQVLACDLAILDINLGPGVPSGIEVFHWLRNRGFTGDIVFLTGHAADDPLVSAAAKLGSTRIYKKPIGMEELGGLIGRAPHAAHP